MTDSDLQKFSDFVRNLVGLDFIPKNWPSLRRSLSRASTSHGFETTSDFIKWLEVFHDENRKIEILAGILTIGETFFFRDSSTFEGVERVIIPEIVKSRRMDSSPVRIWSAGCSTGEEPYSLGILFRRSFSLHKGLQFKILGTDINKESLYRSMNGFYKEWSFRGAPDWLKSDFFTKVTGGYQLDPSIVSMVEFRYLNLVSQDYSDALHGFTPLDLILCRNTMMYFAADLRNRIIDRLLLWLRDDGWLILSPSEAPHVANENLRLVTAPGAVFFRKGRATEQKPLAESFAKSTDANRDWRRVEKLTKASATAPRSSTLKQPSAQPLAKSQSQGFEKDLELAAKALASSNYRKTIEILEANPTRGADSSLLAERNFILARAYANMGMLKEANESIEAALKIEKLNPTYHYVSASILQARNMNQQAIKQLKRVLFLSPEHVMANVTLGTIQRAQRNHFEALRHMRNALTILDGLAPEDILPDSDGATVTHIKEMMKSAMLNLT